MRADAWAKHFSVALVLAFSRAPLARTLGLVLLPLSLGFALLACTPLAHAASGRILPALEGLYRRVLALPIGRGWLRP